MSICVFFFPPALYFLLLPRVPNNKASKRREEKNAYTSWRKLRVFTVHYLSFVLPHILSHWPQWVAW